jgi:hypothetical protein
LTQLTDVAANQSNLPAVARHQKRGSEFFLRRVTGWSQFPAVLLTGLFTLANLLWVVRDRTTPSYDQSHYLYMTWVYRHDLDWSGVHAMIHDLRGIDPGRAPMYPVLMIPIAWFTNDAPSTGTILNIMLWPILLLSTGAIAAHFYGERARLLAIVIVAPLPIFVTLSQTQLQDFLLGTLSTLFIWLLLRSKGFSRFGPSAGMGVVFAVGILTKLSFPVGIAIPTVVVIALALTENWRSRSDVSLRKALRRPVIGLTLFAILGGVVPVVWYVQEWAPTMAYLRTTFAHSPGTVVGDPTSLQNLGEFFLGTLDNSISWQIVIIAMLAVLLSLPQLPRVRIRPTLIGVGRFAFLFSWIFVPYLVVAITDNHGDRYAVASFPAMAVLIAGRISCLSFSPSRWLMTGLVGIAAFTMTMQVESADWRVPGLAASYNVKTRFGNAYLQLAKGLGSAANVTHSDYGANVISYLERLAKSPSGGVRPLQVAILQLQNSINGNTMPYEAIVRGLPFVFTQLFYTNEATLLAALKQTDVALYLPQAGRGVAGKYGRIAVLNNTAAAYGMTPAAFRLFEPDPHKIYVGAGDDGGQGDEMSILVRR